MSDDLRLASLEAKLELMTAQLGRMVDIVERLATVEERNLNLALMIGRVEANVQRQVDGLEDKVTKLSEKTSELQHSVIKFTVIIGGAAAAVAIVIPTLVEYLLR